MNCTRCEGTGFLNFEQVPDELRGDTDKVLEWIADIESQKDSLGGCSCHISPPCSYCMLCHDVSICDCCGDGDGWYGEPGEHNYRKGGDEPYPECA